MTGAARLRLATEPQFAGLYPDVELGAMPLSGRSTRSACTSTAIGSFSRKVATRHYGA